MSAQAERMRRARERVSRIQAMYAPDGTMRKYIGQYPLVIASVAVEKDVPYLLRLTERLLRMIDEGSGDHAAGEPGNACDAGADDDAAGMAERARAG